MATLRALKQYARFVAPHGEDNEGKKIYSVYDKGGNGLRYMGDCTISPKGYKANDSYYRTVEDLFDGFRKWHETLDLPAYLYDPMYNEQHRLKATIIWYLQTLGFKMKTDDFRFDDYILQFGSTVLTITVNNYDGILLLSYHYKGYEYASKIATYQEGFNFINAYVTIVVAETVPMQSRLIGKLKQYNGNVPMVNAVDSDKGLFQPIKDGNKLILARLKELVNELEKSINEKEKHSITK